jgi:hypothetical protein
MDRSRGASVEDVGQEESKRGLYRKIARPLRRVSENKSTRIESDPLQEAEGEEIIGTMIFAPTIWTLEIDGRPTLAFEAMKYREADEICHQEWLRLELGQRKINNVPLCVADSHLRIRLARPAEMLLYRQAAEANKTSDNNLTYLIELDPVVSFR